MHALQLVTSFSFCFRLPEVLRIFDYQSDELMSNLLTELERFKQEGENYWLSKVRCLFFFYQVNFSLQNLNSEKYFLAFL